MSGPHSTPGAAPDASGAARAPELPPVSPPADVARLPTHVLSAPRGASGARRHWGWLRTLRWRVALAYTALLLVLLVVFGLALNLLTARILYTTEFADLQTEVKAAIATGQPKFDADVRGIAGSPTCLGAESYQAAFQADIARPLIASHTGVRAAYLLDPSGDVLTPASDAVPLGTPGPLLERGELRALRSATLANPQGARTGFLADVGYTLMTASGQRAGVVLVADRYHTASRCVNPRNLAVGVVEVVTSFPRTVAILDRVRALFLLLAALLLAVTLLVGVPLVAGALRPLTRMTATMRRIAAGDLSQRVRLPHTGDEVGALAASFDEMIARIEASFAAQQASEERMRQFIADASHELRTPLTAIRGYVDVLLRGAKDDPATEERVLLATRREAERLTRLVNDLLTLARLDAGRPIERQPVDLVALAGEAVDQARVLAGERQITLHTDGRGRLLLPLDADRVKQVLLALLDNALAYGRQGPDGWVRVEVAREGAGAVVRVSDNGPGIAPDDLPHVFDRFYRAERAARQRRITAAGAPSQQSHGAAPIYPPRPPGATPPPRGGSGLGLAIARAIIEAHGGSISAASQPGGGTTFTLTLPGALAGALAGNVAGAG